MADYPRSTTLNGSAQAGIANGAGLPTAAPAATQATSASPVAKGHGTGTQHADGTPVRVLVVDDEPSLAELLSSVLRYEGWSVRSAANGAEAVRAGREFRPDAVVLDIMLPDFDGIEVMRRLSLEEVLARLRGLLRRANLARASSEGSLSVADLTMDEDAREVRRGGELIDLTATEFELLRYLMRNPRRVLSKAQILDRVWNYDFGGQAHVVELYISYLRKKIDSGRDPLIHTVRGVGYVLKPAG